MFIESDLLGYQQRGGKTEDGSGLAYSIVAIICIVLSGGADRPAYLLGGHNLNKAVWAAFETVLGKPMCAGSS